MLTEKLQFLRSAARRFLSPVFPTRRRGLNARDKSSRHAFMPRRTAFAAVRAPPVYLAHNRGPGSQSARCLFFRHRVCLTDMTGDASGRSFRHDSFYRGKCSVALVTATRAP